VPLPYFEGYPGHSLRAWVGYPYAGGPAVLYVQGWTTCDVDKALAMYNGQQPVLSANMLPFSDGAGDVESD
jgi:hypothetical protein